jgi:hypothetical protein
MKRLLIVAVTLSLAGCTNLRQCAMFAPGTEHDACVHKIYEDAANAGVLNAANAYYQH